MMAPQTQERVWSTVGDRESFEQWREVVCQAFTKLSPERLDARPFAGEIRLSAFCGSGTVSHIAAGAQLVRRGRREIAERPCESVFVNFQIAGRSAVRQRGMETTLYPGSFVMLDARQPFEMRFEESFKQACLHLPVVTLEERGFDPTGALCRRADRGQRFAAALFDGVSTLVGDDSAPCHDDFLVQLLQLSFGGERPATLADGHLRHIRAHVEKHCGDADMTPAKVAARFRISVRYLHKLFARSGVSFGRYLLRCRLNRARMALLEFPDCSVLDIALATGFHSASHFARSFKREFGLSPSQLRQQPSCAYTQGNIF